MIKVIGSVLIIFATTLYGVRRASKLSKRHKTLEKTGLCLQVMENEISYTNCCIDDQWRNDDGRFEDYQKFRFLIKI